MQCSEVMTMDPQTIDPEASVGQALDELAAMAIRHLPVVHDNVLVGMVSDRDVHNIDRERPVSDIMSEPALTVGSSAPLVDAIRMMIDHKIGAVPVVDSAGWLVGIVSYVDVLKALRDK